LVSKLVPFDVAMCLPEDEAFAYMVIFADFDGYFFNWSTRQFVKKPPQ
jgi:hypothetical protein